MTCTNIVLNYFARVHEALRIDGLLEQSHKLYLFGGLDGGEEVALGLAYTMLGTDTA